MRILFISRYLPFTGGRETFVYSLINHLKKDHQIGLVTPDGLIGDGFKLYKYEEGNLADIISDFKPEIINSHTHYLSSVASEIASKNNIPFILTLHGDIFTIGSEEDKGKFQSLLDGLSCLITVSGQGKRSVESHNLGKKTKIEVIHNGVDIRKFENDFLSKEPSKTYLRDIYDIPTDKFVYIIPARMAWYKGLEFLIDTVSLDQDYFRRNNIFFLITTPGSRFKEEELAYLDKLTLSMRKNKITDLIKIIFASYDYMPILYRMVDAFILPSVSEQFPVSILEAKASGIPVIATRVGGVPEIVSDMKDGLLVEYNKPLELGNAIKTIFVNKSLSTVLITNARIEVESKYTLDIATANYIRLFEEILSTR